MIVLFSKIIMEMQGNEQVSIFFKNTVTVVVDVLMSDIEAEAFCGGIQILHNIVKIIDSAKVLKSDKDTPFFSFIAYALIA